MKLVALAVVALATWLPAALSAQSLPAAAARPVPFTPPAADAIPDTPLGAIIRFGRDVFVDTPRYAGKYVGNGLKCSNCHLDAGRAKGSAPLWGAYVAYPAFREKNEQVNTFQLRLAGCFTFSMNGTPPPPDDLVMTALVAYSFWLATGAPVGGDLEGRGFPHIAAAPETPSATRGGTVFASHCAACHGPSGAGVKSGTDYTFPPLWGNASYNKGAGMHVVPIAAAFIKANMPLGQPNSLTDQEAWDVATYINSQPRPEDPRLRNAKGAPAKGATAKSAATKAKAP